MLFLEFVAGQLEVKECSAEALLTRALQVQFQNLARSAQEAFGSSATKRHLDGSGGEHA